MIPNQFVRLFCPEGVWRLGLRHSLPSADLLRSLEKNSPSDFLSGEAFSCCHALSDKGDSAFMEVPHPAASCLAVKK